MLVNLVVDAINLILTRLLIQTMLEVIVVDFALNKLLYVFLYGHSSRIANILNKTRAVQLILNLYLFRIKFLLDFLLEIFEILVCRVRLFLYWFFEGGHLIYELIHFAFGSIINVVVVT